MRIKEQETRLNLHEHDDDDDDDDDDDEQNGTRLARLYVKRKLQPTYLPGKYFCLWRSCCRQVWPKVRISRYLFAPDVGRMGLSSYELLKLSSSKQMF